MGAPEYEVDDYPRIRKERDALRGEVARLTAFLHEREMHPDFEYATTDGARKAFDDTQPPVGEGWERNTARGRDGWERFDYHEEAYWRRLKSTAPAPTPAVELQPCKTSAVESQKPPELQLKPKPEREKGT